MTAWGAVSSDTALTRELRISGSQFRKGATAPTDVTVGTTPTVPLVRFDATNELATLLIPIPSDYGGGDER